MCIIILLFYAALFLSFFFSFLLSFVFYHRKCEQVGHHSTWIIWNVQLTYAVTMFKLN